MAEVGRGGGRLRVRLRRGSPRPRGARTARAPLGHALPRPVPRRLLPPRLPPPPPQRSSQAPGGGGLRSLVRGIFRSGLRRPDGVRGGDGSCGGDRQTAANGHRRGWWWGCVPSRRGSGAAPSSIRGGVHPRAGLRGRPVGSGFGGGGGGGWLGLLAALHTTPRAARCCAPLACAALPGSS